MKTWRDRLGFWKGEVKSVLNVLFFTSPIWLLGMIVLMCSWALMGGIEPLSMTSKDCWIGVAINVLLFFISCKIVSKVMEKEEKKEAKEKRERLLRFEIQYANYVSLVYEVAKEHFESCLPMAESKEYLLKFEDYLNWHYKYGNIEKKPNNSFVVAACLMYSLIDNATVKSSETVDFAMKCAWKVISEPITYYYKEGGWVEEKHPKTDIVLADDLLSRINESILQDYKVRRKTSIMQMANLLHLIYLNSGGK